MLKEKPSTIFQIIKDTLKWGTIQNKGCKIVALLKICQRCKLLMLARLLLWPNRILLSFYMSCRHLHRFC